MQVVLPNFSFEAFAAKAGGPNLNLIGSKHGLWRLIGDLPTSGESKVAAAQ
jgi:hypothetical protein